MVLSVIPNEVRNPSGFEGQSKRDSDPQERVRNDTKKEFFGNLRSLLYDKLMK